MHSTATKTSIVTGGGTGIGRAVALALSAAGHRVLICGRRETALRETVKAAEGHAGRIEALDCDLTQAGAVQALVDWAASGAPRLFGLVNNAGISGMNPLDGKPEEDLWDKILETNLTVPYRLCKALVPHMVDGGRILNVSSVLGKFGVPGYSAYCASKHGIIGLTRALAMELAPRKITVNAICPGWVETDMATTGIEAGARGAGETPAEFRRRQERAVPLGRFLQPEEVARLALFLASDAGAGMTGQAINLDGGAAMW
jgi:3-hydroxybutyrate dehydrogenase